MDTPRPLSETPLRSLLFVPGNNKKMIEKALGAGADGVIFDLEDSVPVAGKDKAREIVSEVLKKHHAAHPMMMVRVNSEATPYWETDIKTIVCRSLRGIVVPKIASTQTMFSLEQLLRQREAEIGLAPASVSVFLLIETARGVVMLPELVGFSSRVAGVMFGAEDFCLDAEISRTSRGNELLYPRSYSVICARAFGCRAIDMVFADVNDTKGLRRECGDAKRLGFSGKLAIHPKQIEIIHAAFAPSQHELEEAHKIVKAFDEAQAKGSGVISLGGKMIDQPVAERARRIIARASPFA